MNRLNYIFSFVLVSLLVIPNGSAAAQSTDLDMVVKLPDYLTVDSAQLKIYRCVGLSPEPKQSSVWDVSLLIDPDGNELTSELASKCTAIERQAPSCSLKADASRWARKRYETCIQELANDCDNRVIRTCFSKNGDRVSACDVSGRCN